MRASQVLLLTAASMLVATPGMAAPRLHPAGAVGKAQPRDDKLWTAVQAARPEQMKLWEAVVNIDSGTGDVAGGTKVAAILRERLKALGASIESVPAEAEGLPDNTVATFTGTGKARILIIAHIDTVFGPGTVAKWPFKVDGTTLHGPGVGDEKGGVVEAVTALTLLHDAGFKTYGTITFLIETSEEKGSPGTQKLIKRLVRENDVELNMEPGDAPDAITVWRKGSATYHINVKGRAAHAGVAPQDGRNAAVELIHQLKTVEAMPHSGPGLTANLTILKAGSRDNIIPEDAEAHVNVRVRDNSDFAKVEAKLKASAARTEVPDTKVTVSADPAFPPLPNNPATDALASRAAAIYAGLGRKLGFGGNGGASESAIAAAAGTPALDGLGPVGGGFHSDKEFVDLTTVEPRLYLLTKLLMELSENPPKPMR
jgi:glutamate carboxypeptidase